MTTSHFRISPDLSLDPRQNYARWLISVGERAVLKSTTSIVLRNLLTPQAEWLVANPANPSRIPTAPAELGNNPNAGAIAQWKHATDVANSAIILSNDLKTDIILSLGESIDRETSVGTTGHTTQHIHDILALVHAAYGTIDTFDIVVLEASLVINPDIPFRANIVHFQHVFTQLETILFTSEYSKMKALESACASTPITSIIVHYHNKFPRLADRTFDAMASYIEERIPNLAVSAESHVSHAYTELAVKFAALEARLALAVAVDAAPSIKGFRRRRQHNRAHAHHPLALHCSSTNTPLSPTTHSAHNLSTQARSNSALPPIWDCGATGLFFRKSDSVLLSSVSTGGGLSVGLPNGDTIASTATGIFPTPVISPEAHIFEDECLNRSLVGLAEYCNNGCTMTFTSTSATLTHDTTGAVISRSLKDADATLWPIDLRPAPPPSIASNVIRNEIHADIVAFGHATFFSPTDSAMANALRRGYLGNFPKLTLHMFTQNKPNSIATAKGHLKQTRQQSFSKSRIRHSSPAPDISDVAEPDFPSEEEADEQAYFNSISTSVLRTSSAINYSDMPGRFPFPSHLGHEYMLLSVFRGYIHIELMKNREGPELVRAYRATYDFFNTATLKPQFQMLDNEKSTALDKLLKHDLKVTVELVPPNCHRRNRAERAIQDWKAHFISGLATVNPSFPIAAWDELVYQGQLTINHLRAYTPNRNISAYEGFHGKKYDFVAHPLLPPGVKVVVLTPADKRESWAPHGLDAFYLGPAPDTYRSFRCWILSSGGIRTSDSISVHPHKLKLPGASTNELIYDKLTAVTTLLSNFPRTPDNNAALTSLAADLAALTKTHSAGEQRVPTLSSDSATPEQRVPSDESSATTAHPTASRAKTRRRAVALTLLYEKLSKAELTTKERPFLGYIGRCFTDKEDNHTFQIASIVIPTGTKADKPRVLFYRYYDMHLHALPPTDEADFEHTPCKEMMRTRRDGKTHFAAPYMQWCLEQPATSIISPPHTNGETYLAHCLGLPGVPSPYKQLCDSLDIFSANANSTYHSSPTDQPLNLTPDGRPLTHRSALLGPDGDQWRAEDANEFRRLISTSTIRPILRSDKPLHKKATYYNPQVKEKLDSAGAKTRRTRGTLGGDRCNYSGPTSSPVADISVIKSHQLSVVSDRRNHHTDTKYATIDIKDFYLGSELEDPEYCSIPVRDIPDETMIEFDLQQYVANDTVLFQVDGTMYGHPVAGRIANADLVAHLALHNYLQDPDIPSFFQHTNNLVSFTLVVDDFGIKYTGKDTLEDLIRVLQLKYTIKIDITGQKYVGLRLAWDYIANTVTLDMPTAIPDALARFLPNGPRKKTKTPGIYVPPNYMSPDMRATVDDSPPASAADKAFIMEVVGVFLFYARMIDCTMLPITTFISKQQSKPTQKTLEATLQLLDYAAAHPNHKITLRGCDMQLRVQSDGSHLSQVNAGSIAGGVHYCCNYDDARTVINGPILAVCSTITTVCGSASETEYAALYTNGQHAYFQRTILAALGYPQRPTPIYADNMAAVGIANDTVKLRKSKSYDMRYHWIRDRTRRKIFKVTWSKGETNDADFFTKIQPSTRHQYFVTRFVHT